MWRKFIISALSAVFIFSILGIVLLYTHEKQKAKENVIEQKQAVQQLTASSLPEGATENEVTVKLYFRSRKAGNGTLGLLKSEMRKIKTTPDKRDFILQLLKALIEGPRNGTFATIPPGAYVRQTFIDGPIAVIDLSKEVSELHPGGILQELSTIYSVVNTITENVPGIEGVRILINGQEKETLAGHISIDRTLLDSQRYVVGWKIGKGLIQEENLK